MAEFLVGVVCGLSIAGLLWIVVAPSRRVRAETGIDRELEATVLLGQPLEETTTESPAPSPDAAQPYGNDEIQALRKLGSKPRPRRR